MAQPIKQRKQKKKKKCEKDIIYLGLLNVYKFCNGANSLNQKFFVHDQHISRFMKL